MTNIHPDSDLPTAAPPAPAPAAPPPPKGFPITLAAGLYAALVAISVVGSWLSDEVDLLGALLHGRVNPALGLGLGALAGLLVVGFSRYSNRAWAWARRLEEQFVRLIGPLRPGEVIALAVLSSVAEEIFFRGFLQPLLGLVIASVLFGVLHVGPDRRYLPWTIMALGMGFALGAMMHYTQSLIAPITCHFTINLLNLRSIAQRARAGLIPRSEPGP